MTIHIQRRLRAVMMGTAAAVAMLGAPALAQAQDHVQAFDIPAEDGAAALNDFASQAGVQIVFPYDTVRGRSAPAVRGRLTRGQAAAALATALGLEVSSDQNGVVTMRARGTFRSGSAEGAGQPLATVEEVIVTAQKRAENIQDVPASVSAVSGREIEKLNANKLSDYAAYVPGLNVHSNGSAGQTTITLRGIAPVGPGALVGTYIDDTPVGSSSGYSAAASFELDLMPYDLERLEVLRGPQGTLYGAGTMGGLVKYVLRQPDTNAFSGRIGTDFSGIKGSGGAGWGLRGTANLPIVQDKLAVMASVYDETTPGFIDDAATGEHDINGLTQRGGRLALLWKPADNFSVRLNGLWQRIHSDNNATESFANVHNVSPLGPEYFVEGSPIYGDLTANHVLDEPFDKSIDYYSATLNWDLQAVNVTSATSWARVKTSSKGDASALFGSYYPLLTGGAVPAGLALFENTLALDKFTQEFRVSSPTGQRIEWLVGTYFTREDSANSQDVKSFDLSGEPIPLFSPSFAFASLPSVYKEIALFGDLTAHFTDRFDVTAGGRWAHDSQRFRQISGGAILPTADFTSAATESVVTYMVSPRLRLTPDVMLYGRVGTGFRPGGPNVAPGNLLPAAAATFGPDKLVNYEVGLKSTVLGGRGLINLTAFYIDWSDIQLTVARGGVSYISNAGGAVSKGIELEAAYSPVDGLRLGANAAYTDAAVTNVDPGSTILTGFQLPGVPKWSGALTANYRRPLSDEWTGEVGAAAHFVGSEYGGTVDSANPVARLPGYGMLDLTAGLSNSRWSVNLFIKNLTDKRAFLSAGVLTDVFATPVQIDRAVVQPRTVGIAVDLSF